MFVIETLSLKIF